MEAHVLKRESLHTHDGVMYIEDRDWLLLRGIFVQRGSSDCGFITWLMKGRMSHKNMSYHSFPIREYGKTWRCWDNQPTDKQMKEISWRRFKRL